MMSFNLKFFILAVFLLFGSSVATRVNILKTIVEKEEDATTMMAKQAKIIQLANALLTAAQMPENNLKCLYEGAPCLVQSHCCTGYTCVYDSSGPIGTCYQD